jgi:hypothetical protein
MISLGVIYEAVAKTVEGKPETLMMPKDCIQKLQLKPWASLDLEPWSDS